MKTKNNVLSPVVAGDLEEITRRIGRYLRELEAKTVLISGAAGFLPAYMVHTLAWANERIFKKKVKIICLDNFISGTPDKLLTWKKKAGIKFVKRDIIKSVNIGKSVDYIIHGASIASPVWYRKYPLQTIDVNVTGTRNLLELARKDRVKGFLYLSSSEIYGDPFKEFIPTSEDYWGNVSSTGPRACYDESKRLAETLCMVYFRQFDTPVKIIRPFNVYGPGLRLDDGRVIPDFVNDVLNRRKIKLLGDGKATRSFCYITDAVCAMLSLLIVGKSGEAYNVGNDSEITIGNLAKLIDQVSGNNLGVGFGKSGDKHYLTDNPQRRVPDLAKLKKAARWQPEVSLEAGLLKTITYYKEGRTS